MMRKIRFSLLEENKNRVKKVNEYLIILLFILLASLLFCF